MSCRRGKSWLIRPGLSNCGEFSRVIEKEFRGQSKICGIGVTEDTRLVPHEVKG